MLTSRVSNTFTGAISGVHFDSTTGIINSALVATDNADVSWSFWFRYEFGPFPTQYNIWRGDYENGSNEHQVDSNGGPSTTQRTELNNAAFTAQVTASMTDLELNSGWHHFLCSASLDGSGDIKIYIDGVDQTAATSSFGSGTLSWNGLQFFIGNNEDGNPVPVWGAGGNGFVGDLAQFWFAPGQSLLVDGDIPAETVAAFYSSEGPLDFGTDGSTPTGTAPAVYLNITSGDGPEDFLTNHGTGGDFEVAATYSAPTASLTLPPASGPAFPLPVIVGDAITGATISYTIDWPRSILSQTQIWRRSDTDGELGSDSTLVIPSGLDDVYIYVGANITDALGLWPTPSNGEGVYFGPITTP